MSKQKRQEKGLNLKSFLADVLAWLYEGDLQDITQIKPQIEMLVKIGFVALANDGIPFVTVGGREWLVKNRYGGKDAKSG